MNILYPGSQSVNAGAESIRELFEHLKDSASLVVCNEKKCFGFGFQIFCE